MDVEPTSLWLASSRQGDTNLTEISISLINHYFLQVAQVRGEPRIFFLFSFLFIFLNCSTLEHSATAPPIVSTPGDLEQFPCSIAERLYIQKSGCLAYCKAWQYQDHKITDVKPQSGPIKSWKGETCYFNKSGQACLYVDQPFKVSYRVFG